MLTIMLSAFTIGMANSSSASATGFVVWGAEWCKLVPFGTGGFTNGCRQAAIPGFGEWARAISWPNYLTFTCLWIGPGLGMLADPGCIWLGPGLGYGVFADSPALSITLKGGPYTFESKDNKEAVKVKCTTMQAQEPTLESGGKDDGGKAAMIATKLLEFKGCTVKEPAKCQVASPGTSTEIIDTKPVLGDLVENSTLTKVENLFKPQSGSVFAELLFKGEECKVKNDTLVVEGKTLTDGGAEDEIGNELKIEALGALGAAGDDDLTELAVEKYLLISEPSNKKYLNDETGELAEAKLTFGKEKEELKLLGEATVLGKLAKATFKDEEAGDEVVIEEGPADLGLDRE